MSASGADLQAQNRIAIDAVKIRRDALYEGILALESALAAPAGESPETWAAGLAGPVERLRAILDDHVHGTEGPGGFFEELIEQAPGLAHAVERLRHEHPDLLVGIDTLNRSLAAARDDETVEAARECGVDLIRALLLHRHRGAELVFDAYNVEVATGD